MTRVVGAATPWLRDLLAAPARPARVVHAGADAVYVADAAGRCLGILSASATAVPCGLATPVPSLTGLGAVPRPGSAALVGDGRLVVGGTEAAVGRMRDASVPSLSGPALPWAQQWAAELWRASGRLSVRAGQRMQSVRAELPCAALTCLRRRDAAAVRGLLGRGSGLTPAGDDVLAGWLATLVAARDPGRRAVAAEVARLAPVRTTLLSGTLLGCAARGEVIPELRRLMVGIAAQVERAAGKAAARLLQVGHSSGAALLLGLTLALPLQSPRPASAEGTTS
jgi:hypothetical protein